MCAQVWVGNPKIGFAPGPPEVQDTSTGRTDRAFRLAEITTGDHLGV